MDEEDFSNRISTLRDYISQTFDSYSFVCEGKLDQFPLINVGDLTLQFPCNETLCTDLIKRGELAPFGRGEDTVVDTDVRHGYQIDSDKLEILTESFNELFTTSRKSKLLESVLEQLCPDRPFIKGELYKLLVYGEGHHFKPHRDTQRDKKHFGTLILFFPSLYEGGEFVVRHNDIEKSFSFSLSKEEFSKEPLAIRWVAFYTDCEHEIKPVISGYRVAMTYNLYFGGHRAPLPPKMPSVETLKEKMDKVLGIRKKEFKYIGFILKHRYTSETLTPDLLKGQDRALFDMFESVDAYEVKLRPIEIKIVGAGCGDDEGFCDPEEYFDECIREDYPISYYVTNKSKQHLYRRLNQSIFEMYAPEVLYSDETDWIGFSRRKEISGDVRFVDDITKFQTKDCDSKEALPTGNTGTESQFKYLRGGLFVRKSEKKRGTPKKGGTPRKKQKKDNKDEQTVIEI